MCDYSKAAKKTRTAQADDGLVLVDLPHSAKGFVARADVSTTPGVFANCVTCIPSGSRLLLMRNGKPAQATFYDNGQHSARSDSLHYDGDKDPVNLMDLTVGLNATVISVPKGTESDVGAHRATGLVPA